MLAFFVIMYLAILNSNPELEKTAIGLVVSSLAIMGLLTLYESLRSSIADVFNYSDNLKT